MTEKETAKMKQFAQSGITYYPRDRREDLLHHDNLPAGIYSLEYTPPPFGVGFFLKEAENMELPSKLYGDVEKVSDKFLNTFKERGKSTGILLSGEKGSGKTLQSKHTIHKAVEQGLPAILINTGYTGEEFNEFMTHITQPCVIFIDEFEKLYNMGGGFKTNTRDNNDSNPSSASLLTLLDGTYSSNKLFLLTSNSDYGISKFLKNRPGRIYYKKKYKGIELNFALEYLQDNLKDPTPERVGSIAKYVELFDGMMNFDMMQAIVEEMNRYGENVRDTMECLNVDIGEFGSISYDISEVVPNSDFIKSKISNSCSRFSMNGIIDEIVKTFTTNNTVSYVDVVNEEWDDTIKLSSDPEKLRILLSNSKNDRGEDFQPEIVNSMSNIFESLYADLDFTGIKKITNNGKKMLFENDEVSLTLIKSKPKPQIFRF